MWLHFRSGFPLILVITALSYWLHAKGILIGFESLALETFAISHEKRIPAPHVSIVNISEEFYNAHFKGTYPIHGKALADLIAAIAKGSPRLIAIDLDSSLWTAEDIAALPTNATIIWARNILRREQSQGQPGASYCALEVLGGAKGIDDQYSGIGAFPADPDGIIRLYPRFLTVAGLCEDHSGRESEVQTFPWAVACAYKKQSVKSAPSGEPELILNFLGDDFVFPTLDADDVRQAASAPGSVWSTKGALVDRIALVGGSYRAAHDEHATPRGLIPGVEIAAQAIESELTDGGIRAANEGRLVFLEIVLGTVLLLLGFYLSVRWALLANFFVFLLLAPAASYLSFSTKAQWANFIPMLFAMVIHTLYHEAVHAEKSAEHAPAAPLPPFLKKRARRAR